MVRFLLDRGFSIPSPVLLGKMGCAYVAAINRFVAEGEISVVRFVKGDVKEEIARELIRLLQLLGPCPAASCATSGEAGQATREAAGLGLPSVMHGPGHCL